MTEQDLWADFGEELGTCEQCNGSVVRWGDQDVPSHYRCSKCSCVYMEHHEGTVSLEAGEKPCAKCGGHLKPSATMPAFRCANCWAAWILDADGQNAWRKAGHEVIRALGAAKDAGML